MAYFCRLAVFLEVSGYVTYAIILTVLQCYSLLKTFHFVKQISVFASPKAAKLRIAAQCCIWTIGFALGFGLAWGVEDSVTSENRKSCELKWASGGVTWYRVMLTVAWMHVPGVISFIAIIATQRVRNWVLANNAVNSPTSFAAQVQNNALNKTLAGYFFISVILYHTIALIAATTQPSFLNSTPILVIKLLSQNHVVYGPFIFVFKSRSYRGHVGRILTCGSGEVSPSPASATGNNSSSMPAGRSTGSTTSRSGHRRTAVVPANPAGRPS
ncbi:hypothetical protein AC249_AIPGENE27058 [Exaiptasia diaphana]|nr:hypothetical protein AC249_AIPGENE27058 [Exaiptasia diaphana]